MILYILPLGLAYRDLTQMSTHLRSPSFPAQTNAQDSSPSDPSSAFHRVPSLPSAISPSPSSFIASHISCTFVRSRASLSVMRCSRARSVGTCMLPSTETAIAPIVVRRCSNSSSFPRWYGSGQIGQLRSSSGRSGTSMYGQVIMKARDADTGTERCACSLCPGTLLRLRVSCADICSKYCQRV